MTEVIDQGAAQHLEKLTQAAFKNDDVLTDAGWMRGKPNRQGYQLPIRRVSSEVDGSLLTVVMMKDEFIDWHSCAYYEKAGDQTPPEGSFQLRMVYESKDGKWQEIKREQPSN
jgi:hypothetical protein